MYAFTKKNRLLTKHHFDAVFSQARRIAAPEFTILYRENTLGTSRLGMVVPKKVLAKAHDRNRLKRLIRESFRTHQVPEVDIVFLAKKNIGNLDNAELLSQLGRVWLKLQAAFKK